VCDVALFTIQNEMRAVLARSRLHLHVRGIRSRFLFGQSKCTQLLASRQFWKPSLFLLLRSKEQQRANSNRVVCIHKNGCRCAPSADLFQDFAVALWRDPAPAIFLRRSHAEHADSAKAINHAAWYV